MSEDRQDAYVGTAQARAFARSLGSECDAEARVITEMADEIDRVRTQRDTWEKAHELAVKAWRSEVERERAVAQVLRNGS